VVRSAGLAAAVLLIAALSSVASAGNPVRATFTTPIPANRSSGDHVLISWKLRDAAGHPVTVEHVFVKIVCPTGTEYTTTYAKTTAPGLYRADAVVPPGGIGTVTVRAKGVAIRITNPFHR